MVFPIQIEIFCVADLLDYAFLSIGVIGIIPARWIGPGLFTGIKEFHLWGLYGLQFSCAV